MSLVKNYTEEELFLQAQSQATVPSSFLIRMHKIKGCILISADRPNQIIRQDLVINLNGDRSYLLGQNCTQVEDEKQINLIGDISSPFVSPDHCKIKNCNFTPHRLVLSDNKSKQGTFINGKKLGPNAEHCLQNGDLISLGISHEDPKCILEDKRFWVFKFRGSQINGATCGNHLQTSVLENETGSVITVESNENSLEASILENTSNFISNEANPRIEYYSPKTGNEIVNYTIEELYLKAKSSQKDPNSPSAFLIRMHNLDFRLKATTKEIIRQDFVIDLMENDLFKLSKFNSGNISLEGEEHVKLNGLHSSYRLTIQRSIYGNKKFFIVVNGLDKIFFNGKNLSSLDIKRSDELWLKNGDIISLGISHDDPACNMEDEKCWVFQFKTMSLAEEIYLDELSSQVFGNFIILQNIFETAYKPELKRLRLISKLWNETFKRIKYLEPAPSSVIFYLSGDESRVWKERFANILETVVKYGIQHVSLLARQVEVNSNKPQPSATSDFAEYRLESFQRFFTNHGHQLRKLDIDFYTFSQRNKIRLLHIIFEHCKNLEKVTICKDISMPLGGPLFTATGSVKFLNLNYPYIKNKNVIPVASYENLFKSFPNVVELGVGGYILSDFLGFCKDKESLNQLLPKLKVLRLGKEGNYFFPIPSNFFEHLAKFPIDLKELEIGYFCSNNKNVVEHCKAISRFSKCLEKYLGVQIQGADNKVHLPKMEVLEELTIELGYYNEQREGLKLVWEAESENYPNLKLIKVTAYQELQGKRFLKMLVAEENRKHFPKLEAAFVNYDDDCSDNFVTWKN